MLKAECTIDLARFDAYLVGGYVVRAMRGANRDDADMDIFVPRNDYETMMEHLSTLGWKPLIDGNPSDIRRAERRTKLYSETAKTIDLISMGEHVVGMMERFDLRCCRAAWDGDSFLFHSPEVIDDIDNGVVFIDPVHSFRAEKYRAIFEGTNIDLEI
jgi:hypothetical protein